MTTTVTDYRSTDDRRTDDRSTDDRITNCGDDVRIGAGGPLVTSDAVVAQVIQLKDPEDPIATAVWWRVAELLRACTAATGAGAHLTTTLVDHALNATDDVLTALAVDHDSTSRSTFELPMDAHRRMDSDVDPLPSARTSCLRVARLLFSLDATSPALLATRVNQLRRSLSAWQFTLLDQQRLDTRRHDGRLQHQATRLAAHRQDLQSLR